MTDSQFAELTIKLNENDLKIIREEGYIDCNCELSVRVKLDKYAREKIK